MPKYKELTDCIGKIGTNEKDVENIIHDYCPLLGEIDTFSAHRIQHKCFFYETAHHHSKYNYQQNNTL